MIDSPELGGNTDAASSCCQEQYFIHRMMLQTKTKVSASCNVAHRVRLAAEIGSTATNGGNVCEQMKQFTRVGQQCSDRNVRRVFATRCTRAPSWLSLLM